MQEEQEVQEEQEEGEVRHLEGHPGRVVGAGGAHHPGVGPVQLHHRPAPRLEQGLENIPNWF